MKKLLSLPPNVVDSFHKITHLSEEEFFCGADPINKKLGSGGGTLWLLYNAYKKEVQDNSSIFPFTDFFTWLQQEKRILIHAGGQSRRLAAYAPSSKLLLPVPLLDKIRGQRCDQYLLDLQLPLCENILRQAPQNLHTLVVSGDVLIQNPSRLPQIPNADIVCFGLSTDETTLSHHGAYYMHKDSPTELDFVLQKPSIEAQQKLSGTHIALMDIGFWLLSDKAVERILKQTNPTNDVVDWEYYDLYSDFGCALGKHPSSTKASYSDLSIAILPLPEGAFYHFGTAPEMIDSTIHLTCMRNNIDSPEPNMLFSQNSIIKKQYKDSNLIWIENSYINPNWNFDGLNIVTGIPENSWDLTLEEKLCLDIVPYKETAYIVRPYGFYDTFNGRLEDKTTTYLGQPFLEWAYARHLDLATFTEHDDIQSSDIFPVCANLDEALQMVRFMLYAEGDSQKYIQAERLSANEISNKANLERLFSQRERFRLSHLASSQQELTDKNAYLQDFRHLSEYYTLLPIHPTVIDTPTSYDKKIHHTMFCSEVARQQGRNEEAIKYNNLAFQTLQETIVSHTDRTKEMPIRQVLHDQIVCSRSAVRIDLAGGWTDTPPFCLLEGGNVVNVAIELNHQQPIQIFVKPCKDYHIVCHSIDLSATEIIETYEQIADFQRLRSPFSIPKVALALCGFLPSFCTETFSTLRQQLEAFGGGFEITMLSAIPAGSGLGTSSVLSATVLAALAEFCGLRWSKETIGKKTFVLEQLLTSGGGWQDQYGGILPGVKLLHTESGPSVSIDAHLLSNEIFVGENAPCHLLYYTGLTRTAKDILGEIVRCMFLNDRDTIRILYDMKEHALDMSECLQAGDFLRYGQLIRKTWEQNKALDQGTCPPLIQQLCQTIDDFCLGYKLPGAGGGGYMYMVTKDPDATQQIKSLLQAHPITPTARFVEMNVSPRGLFTTKS